ncbi:MAG: hypothetical protein LBP59_05135 [Planctomycetaceae bacterium]|nr:hypothetical protein [Planctomycetaceae bacterium]
MKFFLAKPSSFIESFESCYKFSINVTQFLHALPQRDEYDTRFRYFVKGDVPPPKYNCESLIIFLFPQVTRMTQKYF